MGTYECENRRMERIIEERDDEIDRLRDENERLKRSLENAITDREIAYGQLKDAIEMEKLARDERDEYYYEAQRAKSLSEEYKDERDEALRKFTHMTIAVNMHDDYVVVSSILHEYDHLEAEAKEADDENSGDK